MIIALDFDGTCVASDYPRIGPDIGAVPVLKELASQHKLILWTCRSGKSLDEATRWFQENDIPLHAVNENPEQKNWSDSPKAQADLYIDDKGACIPIKFDSTKSREPYIDWGDRMLGWLMGNGVLTDY